MTRKTSAVAGKRTALPAGYAGIHGGIVELLDAARQAAARSVNALMTASYWEIGRRIVEAEQNGRRRAGYGEQLMARLSADLTARFGRGFSPDNLENMRRFFAAYPLEVISELSQVFTLPWSAYVRLLSVKDDHARQFYETEALRGGWSVRQLDRQIGSQFYARTALSKDKAAMLVKGSVAKPEDAVTPNDAIKDPYVLEFLDLKDEYSESDLEAALIQLLELGEGFTFVGRQRRLRIDQTWYRVDLLFFHRNLRCLVIIDLKLGSLTHADVGQMHMYCNYAKKHWAYPDADPPPDALCFEFWKLPGHKHLIHDGKRLVLVARWPGCCLRFVLAPGLADGMAYAYAIRACAAPCERYAALASELNKIAVAAGAADGTGIIAGQAVDGVVLSGVRKRRKSSNGAGLRSL